MIINATWTKLDKGLSGRQVGVLYEFRLSKPPVLFTLSAVRETRGGLQAEIRVDSIAAGEEGHVLRDHITLISTRSKNAFAKALGDRTKVAIGWAEIVEVIAFATADTFRQGEPVVDLAEVPDDPEDRTYLLRFLLPYLHPTVLYGDGMAGKSITAISIALAVATGEPLPGLTPEKAPVPVLYLDWETSKEVHAHYLRSLARGHQLNLPKGMVLYRRMARSVAIDAGRIKEEIDRHGVGLLVVDSMIPACGGEPESAETVLRFFNAIRGLGSLTTLIISHITKAETERKGLPRPFGSVMTTNTARATWFARRAMIGSDELLEVAFYQTKINFGRRFAPRGIRYRFGQESDMTLRLSEFSVEGIPELAEHMPLSGRIRGVVRSGSLTIPELAEELAANPGSIKSTLHRMKDMVSLDPDEGSKARRWARRAFEDDSDAPPAQEPIPF